MTPSTAIVIYSISYSDGVLRELPYVEYFYERCLSQLGRLTDSETRVVVVTPAPVDPVILNYHFSDILGLSGAARRSAVRRTLFLSPDSSDVGSLAERVLDDDRLLSRLLDERSAADDVTLVNFAASDAIAQLGTLLGIEVEEGPPELATRWGSKSGSKTAFERGGVPAAAGTADVLRSTAEVTSAALDLARRHDVSRVVVKLDDAEWASGIGNAVVDIEQLRATQRLESAIVQILQPWDDFAAEVGRGGAIVEEYLRDVACTPSGQGYIEPDGNVRVVSTHDQHVVHDEYVGCVYPATSRWGTGIEVALGMSAASWRQTACAGRSASISFAARRVACSLPKSTCASSARPTSWTMCAPPCRQRPQTGRLTTTRQGCRAITSIGASTGPTY